MDADGALAGLSDVPWEEIPCGAAAAALLPAVAAGSEDAFWELADLLCHQGTLYPVTAPVVPFLARMAAAGIRATDMLTMLALIGRNVEDPGFPAGDDARAAGEALAGQLDLLVPLLSHSSAAVREAAVLAVAESGDAERAVPALRCRWAAEAAPVVQAAILRGLAMGDPAVAAAIAENVAAGSGDPVVRAVAAWACVTAGLPWKAGFADAAVAWMRHGGFELHGLWWLDGDPLTDLVRALCARGDLEIASGLVAACLVQPAAPECREKARFGALILRNDYGIEVPEP